MLKKKNTLPPQKTKQEKLREAREAELIASQYAPGFEQPSATDEEGKIKVTSRPSSKKTKVLQIGDYTIEVIDPQYVSELESTIQSLEKRIKNVENANRRIHTQQNKLTDELNKTKRNMPNW